MSSFRHLLLALALLAGAGRPAAAAPPESSFSTDRAMRHLRMLADTIGPRPLGSPAEHRALAYALRALTEAGCRDTFLMPFTACAGLNTNSGIAVGVLPGQSGRIIVLGGHIDSEGPDVPGANDDGSGAACVLEMARVLAQAPHHATLLFCLWGGEERGECGSTWFVDHYPLIDSVRLMLQVDMADGGGPLLAWPDGPSQVSAPRWLTDAAYDVFYHELHETGLIYPTQFLTVNTAGGSNAGSDHEPFLQYGIPAINFTSDMSYPIHTPLDNLKYFTPSGLKRSGDLVIGLVRRFDAGQPAGSTEEYWLLQVGHVPLFIPHWAIRLYGTLAVAAALWLLIVLFRRERRHRAPGPHLSGLKLFGVALFVSLCVWMSPTLVGVLNGYRFPWAGQFPLFVVLGALAAVLASLLSVRWLLRVGLSRRVAPMFLRAALLPLALTALFVLYGQELAVYPATILALWVLAIAVPRPWVGFLACAGSLLVAWNLIFNEGSGFFEHAIAWSEPPSTFWWGALYHLLYIIPFGLLTAVFAWAGAAWYRSVGHDWLRLRILAQRRGLTVVTALLAVCVVSLALHRPDRPDWQPSVRVKQAWNAFDTSGMIRINGSEKLRGVTVHWQGRDSLLSGDRIMLPAAAPVPDAWCAVTARDSLLGSTDSTLTFLRVVEVRMPVRPVNLTVTYASRSPFDAFSPFLFGTGRPALDGGPSGQVRALRFYSFPDTLLHVPVTLTVKRGQTVVQTVEASFDTLATPVRFAPRPEYLQTTLVVTRRDSLRPAGQGIADATGGAFSHD